MTDDTVKEKDPDKSRIAQCNLLGTYEQKHFLGDREFICDEAEGAFLDKDWPWIKGTHVDFLKNFEHCGLQRRNMAGVSTQHQTTQKTILVTLFHRVQDDGKGYLMDKMLVKIKLVASVLTQIPSSTPCS